MSTLTQSRAEVRLRPHSHPDVVHLLDLVEELGPCPTCDSGNTMLVRGSGRGVIWACLDCRATTHITKGRTT